MEYTFKACFGHTFEIISIKRLITPLSSMVSIEALVFNDKQKEIARTQWNQVPMSPRFYEHSTTFYPECRVDSTSYSADNLEACSWLGERYGATELADYSLRAP